ncbi:MAG: MBL fold metallo-hydrolase [Oscillibacter sp.]|nr:MBL fold metallo-hydrolase [Oscillibacter sp.]
MSILQVLNVGQGDSMILRPDGQCCFKDETFVIDLGSGGNDITKYINSKEKVNIVLTHHDTDHFGGFKFFVGMTKQIQKIIVPFHQNEITLIAKSILSLKGIKSSEDCGEFIGFLEGIVGNQLLLRKFSDESTNQQVLSFAYDERDYCAHITCMNPPVLLETYDWLGEMDEVGLFRIMQEIFEPEYAEAMRRYVSASGSERIWRYIDSHEIDDIFLREDLELNPELGQQGDIQRNIQRNKGNFVVNFIMENLKLFREFNNKPIRKNLQKIYNNYVSCTHDVCVVLRARYQGRIFLLTGDASKKVFYRLLEEGKDISADYLKVPHHGSRENLDEQILKEINPRVAIISHNNRRFGKAKDSHPNLEVLSLLQKHRIKILITNDIVKDGLTYMQKANHMNDANVDII